MQRKGTALALALLSLTACSSTGGTCDKKIEGNVFSICLPADWQQVPDENLRAEGVPEETVAAFQMETDRGGQRDNVVITKERIKSGVTSMQYAEVNVKIMEKTPEYRELEKREIEIDGEKTLMHAFSTRAVPNLPARRYYQVSFAKDTTGYVVTGTLPLSVDESIEEALGTMITSVSFKKAE